MVTLAALALAVALAEPIPAPAGDAEGSAPHAADTSPEGSEADRRLWRELRGATNGATLGMARLSQCSFRIRYGRYYERLDAALKEGSDPEKAEARALRERLATEAKEAEAAVPAQPGVRACQYVLRDLGILMAMASEPRAKKRLPTIRGRATACVAKLVPLGDRLRERATGLEAALAAVDARPPPAGTAAGPSGAPGRTPAAAEGATSPAPAADGAPSTAPAAGTSPPPPAAGGTRSPAPAADGARP